ncbi:G-protein coupled receptor GRL101-like protein [Trichoplax sp. H2]|nr:G-protein coupled receptor GRL101-like protein [Trichoplax sp. H2]|eukprot:RDD36408.1 G-protein coupled receptor GRL101-like protein [Trichoplax sp. H2]
MSLCYKSTQAVENLFKTVIEMCSILYCNAVAKVLAWLLGFGILISTFSALQKIGVVYACKLKRGDSHRKKRFSFLILNTAFGAWFGSAYLIIIAFSDHYYTNSFDYNNKIYYNSSDNYPLCHNFTLIWLKNPLCSIARFSFLIGVQLPPLTMLVLSFDRYYTIVKPLNCRYFRSRNIKFVVCCLWLYTLIVATISAIRSLQMADKIVYDEVDNICSYGSMPDTVVQFTIFLTMMTTLIAYTLCIILNVKIIIHIKRASSHLSNIQQVTTENRVQIEKYYGVFVFLLATTNTLSCLPATIVVIIRYLKLSKSSLKLGNDISIIAYFLQFINAFINPYLVILLTSKTLHEHFKR